MPSTATDRSHRVGVLASAATGLVEFIQQAGGDPDSILGRAGINPECLNQPTLSLDLHQYCAVFEEAARQTHDAHFGLRYGRQFKPDALGLLGYIGMSSATLGDALRNVVRAFPYHQQGSLLRLDEQGPLCRLDYQVQHGGIRHKRQDAELSLGMFFNLMRHALGTRWAPEQVHFEHARPEAWYEHCKAFDAPAFFDQPSNALVFQRSVLEQPMPGRDGRLLALMFDNLRQLAGSAGEGAPRNGLMDEARRQIRLLLESGEPNLEKLADALRLPSWTLQRRLNDEGLSFSSLLDQTRRELASLHLEQGVALAEITALLGYSELSAFSRAFRRWHGLSPRQWRQARQGTERN